MYSLRYIFSFRLSSTPRIIARGNFEAPPDRGGYSKNVTVAVSFVAFIIKTVQRIRDLQIIHEAYVCQVASLLQRTAAARRSLGIYLVLCSLFSRFAQYELMRTGGKIYKDRELDVICISVRYKLYSSVHH